MSVSLVIVSAILTVFLSVILGTASAGFLGALVYAALAGCAVGAAVFVTLIVRDARGGRLW